jgi:hypothetical protein
MREAQGSCSSAPNSAMAEASASAWPSTRPVMCGRVLGPGLDGGGGGEAVDGAAVEVSRRAAARFANGPGEHHRGIGAPHGVAVIDFDRDGLTGARLAGRDDDRARQHGGDAL